MSLRILRYVTKASPLLLAFICTGFGMHLFRDVPPEVRWGNGVRAAGIFRTAVLILLWRVRIYPTSLKKLGRTLQLLIEFVLAMFVVEYLQADFWLPLEAAVRNLLGKIAQTADDSMQRGSVEAPPPEPFEYNANDTDENAGGYPAEESGGGYSTSEDSGGESTKFADYINNEWTVCFLVYGISSFFFISALHAAKFIDLREAKYGPEPFLYAITHAYQKFQELTRNQKALNERRRATTERGRVSYGDRHDDQKSIKGSKNGQKSIEGSRNNQKGIDRKKDDQKAIEWKKEKDHDLIFDDNYSDFEMDYMDD